MARLGIYRTGVPFSPTIRDVERVLQTLVPICRVSWLIFCTQDFSGKKRRMWYVCSSSIATQDVADCLAVEPANMAQNQLFKLCGFPDGICSFPAEQNLFQCGVSSRGECVLPTITCSWQLLSNNSSCILSCQASLKACSVLRALLQNQHEPLFLSERDMYWAPHE